MNYFYQEKLDISKGVGLVLGCFAEEKSKFYGDNDCYRPLVLENNNGERIWIHIPYTKWVSWTSLQKK